MKTYNAIYRVNGADRVVLGIDHLPIMGAVVPVPDGSNQYGKVISAERDGANSCLRDYPFHRPACHAV